MKAKNQTNRRHHRSHEAPLPHEVGAHLFALIKRNLLARQAKPAAPRPNQLTFAF